MKVIILGSTGMLGNTVGKYFIDMYGEDNVFLSYRDKDISYGKMSFYFDALNFSDLFDRKFFKFPRCDYMINCIGLIKQDKKWDVYKAIKLNSCFPLELGRYCKDNNCRLIHVTTDCVFSGRDGGYTEEFPHDALDEYGKSKSLGEACQRDAMVLRTSLIGEEIHKNISLLSWVKSMDGKTVKGYVNHLWNGITALQYAKVCEQIIEKDLYEKGLYHVFSDIVTKYELISMISKHFNLNVIVEPFKTEINCNRTLSTVKKLNSKLNIPTVREQLWQI